MNKLKGNSNLELKDGARIAVLGGGPVSKPTSETNGDDAHDKISFDDFLIDCAKKEGAKVENIKIDKVELNNGNPEIFSKGITLEEGEFFGEMSLFDNNPRSATVKAIGDIKLLEINQKNLLKKISKDPSLAFRILEKMSQRIRITDEKILNQVFEMKNIAKDSLVFT